jgi:hypothetical protein
MPAPANATTLKRKVSIQSKLKGDTVPWWIVSASLLVIGSSAILVAVSTGRR